MIFLTLSCFPLHLPHQISAYFFFLFLFRYVSLSRLSCRRKTKTRKVRTRMNGMSRNRIQDLCDDDVFYDDGAYTQGGHDGGDVDDDDLLLCHLSCAGAYVCEEVEGVEKTQPPVLTQCKE
ncbi:hypothetical protein T439DRAFT_6692 [Meredithblackwellia eburnea MCA 4105]